jgi:hypothetical protein
LPNFGNSLRKEINVQRNFPKASREPAAIISAIDASEQLRKTRNEAIKSARTRPSTGTF